MSSSTLRPTLRFDVGSAVLFKPHVPDEHGECGWFEGQILSLWYRDPEWPQEIPVAPYLIARLDEDLCAPVFTDTDEDVRVLPDDKTPDPSTLDSSQLPEQHDPYAFEYTGVRNEMGEEQCLEVAAHLESTPGCSQIRHNPDGSMSFKLNGRQEAITTATVSIPQEPVHGVPGHAIMAIGINLTMRRHISSISSSMDYRGLLESIVPTERSLSELEQAATTDSAKMLQLADALMSGVHGWPRDPNRACNLYRAAAWGCSEEEEPYRNGIPVGVPEAFCAEAYIGHILIKKDILGHDLLDNVHPKKIMAAARRNARVNGIIHQVLFWLSSAVTRGWICPLALAYGEAVMDGIVDDPELEELAKPLIAAWKYRTKEAELEELQERGLLPRGDPSNSVLEKFASKAVEIFRSLPMEETVPLSNVSSKIHIEFRELSIPPFPIFVFVIIPSSKTVIKLIKLPDYLQLSPFSLDSFEYVWLRIAFELHLGTQDTGTRYRPAVFTVLESPGDLEFREYLVEKIDPSVSGSQVLSVRHGEVISSDNPRSPVTLGAIMSEIESDLTRDLRSFMQVDSFDSIRSIAQEATSSFYERQSMTKEQLLEKAQRLKTEGNDLFVRNRHVAARKCYADAIHLLKTVVDPDEEVYSLLGTLLSNRVACYLEMVENVSTESGIYLMKDAVTDCNLALESSWSDFLPHRMTEKLAWRRDKALAKKTLFSTLVQNEENGTSDRHYVQNEREERQGQRGQRRRGPSGRRNRQQRQRERERQRRQQRNRGERRRTEQVSDHEGTFQLREEPKVSDATDACVLLLGKDLCDAHFAKNATGEGDCCPICIRRFRVELADDFCSVLSCGHAHCIQCLAKWKKSSDKSSTNSNPMVYCCSLCMAPVESDYLRKLSGGLIACVEPLNKVMSELPLSSEREKREVVHKLLVAQSFQLDLAEESIENMLVDQARGSLWQSEDLTYEQKNGIYEQARRPVQLLRQELQEARTKRDEIRDYESEEHAILERHIQETRDKLSKAQRNASKDIFHRINSAGTMGRQQAETGDLTMDFHGLHVNEALAKFEDEVVPVLPVLRQMLLITGRGLHSKSGMSVIKKALTKRIDEDRRMRWKVVKNNEGVVRVLWTALN